LTNVDMTKMESERIIRRLFWYLDWEEDS
jgi:hypothetical protein